jgi:xanthine dehydrogenase accessory factor
MTGEDHAVLQELLAAQSRREPVALAVIIRDQGSVPRHAGTKMLVYGDGRTLGTIGGGEMEARVVAAAAEALRDGQTRLVPYSLVDPQRGDPGVCGGSVEVYVEPHLSPATLTIVGCGHVGRALASLGHWLGYRVVAWDDRAELATTPNVPDADVLLSGPLADALAAQPIDARTYVAVVTRNVSLDRQILPHLLETPAAYIGVMGSRRRWQETQRQLLDDGLSAERLARITAPIGLELNAESPAEIAVSIMAQIIMAQRGGDGRPIAAPSNLVQEESSAD